MGDDALARFAASSAAAAMAEVITLPLDVAKVRLQVQQVPPKYTGFVDCVRKTAAEEGFGALYKGLAPALLRQVSYSSLSMVLYEPVRNAIVSDAEKENAVPFYKRLLAGGLAGGAAIALVNPTEVLKTQQQTYQGSGRVAMFDIAKRVYARDGVLGFWAGVQPNVARTFLVQAAELGTYLVPTAALCDVYLRLVTLCVTLVYCLAPGVCLYTPFVCQLCLPCRTRLRAADDCKC
jgi:hypothetical protein